MDVTVSSDKKQAKLILSPDVEPSMLTASVIHGLLTAQGVKVNAAVEDRVKQILANQPEGDQRLVVASATLPKDGIDGRIDWVVDERHPDAEPAPPHCVSETTPPPSDADETQPIDFYNQSVFVVVEQGEVVANRQHATFGDDGVDVIGESIAAKPGKSPELVIDESLVWTDQDSLVAQRDGVLIRQGEKASISPLLEVENAVDFSVGNIDFKGSLLVHGKVCDNFEIKVTQNITIEGQIEAATIQCGGDLIAKRGIATRGQSTITVQGRLQARYVHGSDLHVQQHALIEKELVNSRLEAEHGVNILGGILRGGSLIAGGPVKAAVVGSEAGVRTEIMLGRQPRLEIMASELRTLTEQVRGRASHWEQAAAELSESALSNADRERLTESLYMADHANKQLARSKHLLNNLEELCSKVRAELSFERMLYAGVMITYGDRVFQFTDNLRGPATVMPDPSGKNLIYKDVAGRQPLCELPQVRLSEAAHAGEANSKSAA